MRSGTRPVRRERNTGGWTTLLPHHLAGVLEQHGRGGAALREPDQAVRTWAVTSSATCSAASSGIQCGTSSSTSRR